MIMAMARAPIYENMQFPVYEYQEYPKAITIPEGLEDNFTCMSNNMANMVFVHDENGNIVNRPARKYTAQVQVNSEEEEAAVLAKIKKLQGSSAKPVEDKK
jgi:hypothetical protein